MSKQTAASFFIESPSLANSAELYQVLLSGIERYQQLAGRLIKLAEHAHACRQFDRVRDCGQILANLPIKDVQAIGHYFLAVATHRKAAGDRHAARRLLERAVDAAPDAYKIKATLSLGALAFHSRDFDAALYYYRETVSAGLSAASLHAIKAISVIKAIDGDHRRAVSDLESILPVVRYTPPHICMDILNSYAVELGEVGRVDEARNVMRVVLASPLAFAYPEWRETAAELQPGGRSSVVIEWPAAAAPANVLALPVDHVRRQSVAEWHPATVLDFGKWKARMLKAKKVKPQKRMSEKAVFMRLMDILTDDDTTPEQKRKIWEAAESIIAKPGKPDSDKPAS
ncbi:MAG TPA: hypothetical protein VIS78_14000 [Blastocatellia bacterium]